MSNWQDSKAKEILDECPTDYNEWISLSDMTDKEKAEHPESKTTGGFLRVYEADRQKWWDELSKSDKQTIYDLPNFDKEKFEECVGVKVR